jgi:predicted nucleotidyltransferase
VVSDILDPLFRKERDWMEHLVHLLVKDVPGTVVSLALFGSVPKGRSGPKSDVDLLVLVDKKASDQEIQEHFLGVGGRVFEAFRRPLAPVMLAKGDFKAAYAGGQEFAREVASTGRVIYGKLMTEVLRGSHKVR